MEELARVGDKYGIGDKIRRTYQLQDELLNLLKELQEYGFNHNVYIAPFGHTSSVKGAEYVEEAYKETCRDSGNVINMNSVKVLRQLKNEGYL